MLVVELVKKIHYKFMLSNVKSMPRIVSRLLACLVFYIFLITSAQTTFADFSETDKLEIKSIVKDFITKNPEIIRDVLTQLALTEQAEQQRAAFALVRQDEGDPEIGPSDATITIYEFSDYNCGYCKRIFTDLQAVLAQQADVKLVVKEFPILAETSVLAAKAAIAAQRQGKFEQFHVALMTWRGRIDADAIEAAGRKAGLDSTRLRADMQDDLTAAIINRTRAAATALEIRGTPALVIGETVIPGVISKNEILDLINQTRIAKN